MALVAWEVAYLISPRTHGFETEHPRTGESGDESFWLICMILGIRGLIVLPWVLALVLHYLGTREAGTDERGGREGIGGEKDEKKQLPAWWESTQGTLIPCAAFVHVALQTKEVIWASGVLSQVYEGDRVWNWGINWETLSSLRVELSMVLLDWEESWAVKALGWDLVLGMISSGLHDMMGRHG